MPPKSILELEEAQRRLEQMSNDHQSLTDLVRKLKEIKEAIAKTLDNSQARLQQQESLRLHMEQTLTRCANELQEFREKGKTAVDQVSGAGTKIETKLSKLVTKTQKEVDGLISEVLAEQEKLDAKFAALTTQQKQLFDEFRHHHDTKLDAIEKAYGRAKQDFESHGPVIDRLDAKLDRIIETHAESAAAMRAEIEEAEARNAEKIAVTQASLEGKHADSLRRMAENVDVEMGKLRGSLSQQDKEIARLSNLLDSTRMTMWLVLFVTFCVFCGFVLWK